MKLTNDEITALGNQGIARLNYGKLPPEDGIKAYRLRRDIVRAYREIEQAQREIRKDVWDDEELLQRCIKYETTGAGMTDEEYRAAIADNMPKAQGLLIEYGKETREFDVHPIDLESWIALLKDNPFLAGFEEVLDEWIIDATK